MGIPDDLVRTLLQAKMENPSVGNAWRDASFVLGALRPKSSLPMSLQFIGDIDIVLRCFEHCCDNKEKDPIWVGFCSHYQIQISETWISLIYESLRSIKQTGNFDSISDIEEIFNHISLVRMAVMKHEIAGDRKVSDEIWLHRMPAQEDEAAKLYDPNDRQKSFTVPRSLSTRNSVMWCVIDVKKQRSIWIERLQLSERLLGCVAQMKKP